MQQVDVAPAKPAEALVIDWWSSDYTQGRSAKWRKFKAPGDRKWQTWRVERKSPTPVRGVVAPLK
jgi:hypothetical protein